MTILFQLGHFTAHSGQVLPFKIDCDALTDADLDCLARYYASTVTETVFDEITGVPTGGLRFAEALRRCLPRGGPYTECTNLIVDDVLTTGASMEQFRQQYPKQWCAGVVIFARGPCPSWVTPLFILHR